MKSHEFTHGILFLLADSNTNYSLLSLLVLFITGSMVLGSNEKFDVIFQVNPEKKLLEADSCFNRVLIPTSHQTYEKFQNACCISLKSGAAGYGRF